MEKTSFIWLKKLFEIDATEQAYKVILSNKNLLALIDNPKSFIIPVFPHLALPSLVSGEHFMLKDLPFYKIARLADSKACQAHLEEREKKCQEWTLRQAPVAGRPSSSSIALPPTQKRKEPVACPIQRVRTPPSTSLSSSFDSSSPSSTDEPEAGFDQVVPPIICEEEEEEDMTSNLRVRFCDRQRKRLSESIIINPTLSKKACLKPASASLPVPILSATIAVITLESDENFSLLMILLITRRGDPLSSRRTSTKNCSSA